MEKLPLKAEHRIRLPNPWNVSVAKGIEPNRSSVGRPSQAVTQPASVAKAIDLNSSCIEITTFSFQRTFQCPSGLDNASNIELEIQVQQQDIDRLQLVECQLNDQTMECQELSPGRSRIRLEHAQLRQTNQLLVRIAWLGEQPDSSIPQVAIVLS